MRIGSATRVAAVGNTLRQRYMHEIADEAEVNDLTMPLTLGAFIAFLEHQNCRHTIDTLPDVREHVDRLRHLALPDRDLMRAIIEKILALGGSREDEYGVSAHPDDLKTILIDNKRLSDYRIGRLGKTLERNGLGGALVADAGEGFAKRCKPNAAGSALFNDSAGCGTSRINHQINALT
jgi:hypothetical protein